MLFGLARRPELATASYCLLKASETLHSAGMSPNRLEVYVLLSSNSRLPIETSLNLRRGDVDAGVLSSVVNVSATLPAYILPFLGLWIRCARRPTATQNRRIMGRSDRRPIRVAFWLCL